MGILRIRLLILLSNRRGILEVLTLLGLIGITYSGILGIIISPNSTKVSGKHTNKNIYYTNNKTSNSSSTKVYKTAKIHYTAEALNNSMKNKSISIVTCTNKHRKNYENPFH